MFDRLSDRAEQIGGEAVERARQRIVGELDAPGMTAEATERGVTLTGRRLSERLWWVGGLFR